MPEGPAARQRRQKQHCQPQYRGRARTLADVLKQAMDARRDPRSIDPYRLALFIIEGSTAIILERLTEESSPAMSRRTSISSPDSSSTAFGNGVDVETNRSISDRRCSAATAASAQTQLTFDGALAPRARGQQHRRARRATTSTYAEAHKSGLLSAVMPRITLQRRPDPQQHRADVRRREARTRVTILPRNDWAYQLMLSQPIFAGRRELRAYSQAKIGIENAREGARADRGRRAAARGLELPRRRQRRPRASKSRSATSSSPRSGSRRRRRSSRPAK